MLKSTVERSQHQSFSIRRKAMMFENDEQMRSYLAARGVQIENERVFVGRFCSFFTQGSEIHGLSGLAMEHGGSPDFRGYLLKDRQMMLSLQTSGEAEIAGPDRIFVNVGFVGAAACWGVAEIGFLPGACVNVRYDNPLLFRGHDTEIENDEFTDGKSNRKDTQTRKSQTGS
jgi:hypothetical protein